MKKQLFFFFLILTLLSSFCWPEPALAARGTPTSLEFARGIWLDVNNRTFESDLRSAVALKVDWVNVDYDWGALSASAEKSQSFANALKLLKSANLSVVVSLINAPKTAQSLDGPNADQTAALVSKLISDYPQILAIEIFPMANLKARWGSKPNPTGYASLLQKVEARIRLEKKSTLIIAGGLSNLIYERDDMPAPAYLQKFYESKYYPALISLRFRNLSSDLLRSNTENCLRYYEQAREIMLKNNHRSGLIWLMEAKPQLNENITWYQKATDLARAQLYMGAIFYNSTLAVAK